MRTRARTPSPIPIEVDVLIHTDEHPYCNDLTCPCQDDLQVQLDCAEVSFIEAGMTERWESLPWQQDTTGE